MLYYVFKTGLTLVLIIAVTEIAKRSSLLGALVASIPIVSVLAMIWLYVDTQDTARVASLSRDIFWLVLPSLSLFIVLPLLLQHGVNFWLSLGGSLLVMFACYLIMWYVLGRFGIGV